MHMLGIADKLKGQFNRPMKAGVSKDKKLFQSVKMVRDKVGPVAAFK